MGLPRISHLRQTLFSMLFQPVTLPVFGFQEKEALKAEVYALFTGFFIEKNHNA